MINNTALRAGVPGRFGAWIRYGGDPITQKQLEFAVQNYSVAILQPWEQDAALYLKKNAPDMVVLAYKCLSSTRSYEPGPIYSSGVSWDTAQQALQNGKDLYARRTDGSLIEWRGYPQHYQMAVWNPDYRWYWMDSVVKELRDSPFDGVMGDNDIESDYYGLNLPIRNVDSMATVRAGLDHLIEYAGAELNKAGKILVPNIAEARLRWGKWEAHSAYGGGFEEVWLGWGAQEFLDSTYAMLQSRHIGRGAQGQVRLAYDEGLQRADRTALKVTILRTPSGGPKAPVTGTDENLLYGLAGFWIFGGGRFTGIAVTEHDSYNGTPFSPEMSYDLGTPAEAVKSDGAVHARAFTNGWAAINLGTTSRMVRVPGGLKDAAGNTPPSTLTLQAHCGVLYRK